MIDAEERKKAREIVFNTRTKEQIEALLLETEKELQNPNTKLYTMEEMKKMTEEMICEFERLQDKVS